MRNGIMRLYQLHLKGCVEVTGYVAFCVYLKPYYYA